MVNNGNIGKTAVVTMSVDKASYSSDENVKIQLKPTTSNYPFKINENWHTYGVNIFRIPDDIDPKKTLTESDLARIVDYNASFGVVHIENFTNNQPSLEIVWDKTVVDYNSLDFNRTTSYYPALKGHYLLYHKTVYIPETSNYVKFSQGIDSVFHIDGFGATLDYHLNRTEGAVNVSVIITDSQGESGKMANIGVGLSMNGTLIHSENHTVLIDTTPLVSVDSKFPILTGNSTISTLITIGQHKYSISSRIVAK